MPALSIHRGMTMTTTHLLTVEGPKKILSLIERMNSTLAPGNAYFTGIHLIFLHVRPLFLHMRLLYLQKKYLSLVRRQMAECATACDSLTCVKIACADLSRLREGYAQLIEISGKLPHLAPLRRDLINTLEELDELADDCAVSLDPEIRDMLCRFADAV